MADEAKQTQGEEVKTFEEGSVDAEMKKVEETVKTETPTDKKTEDTVPLAVFLELKKDLKDLQKEIKESKSNSKSEIEIQGVNDLAKKYPDVDPNFISDVLKTSTTEAEKKIEEKYSPIIKKQEEKEKQIAFDKAFDNLFDKTLQENPDLPSTVDKELVKELAMTPKYRNVPLSDVLIKMYGTKDSGKASSEDDTRSSSDVVDEVTSYDKITPEQESAIMKNLKLGKNTLIG